MGMVFGPESAAVDLTFLSLIIFGALPGRVKRQRWQMGKKKMTEERVRDQQRQDKVYKGGRTSSSDWETLVPPRETRS